MFQDNQERAASPQQKQPGRTQTQLLTCQRRSGFTRGSPPDHPRAQAAWGQPAHVPSAGVPAGRLPGAPPAPFLLGSLTATGATRALPGPGLLSSALERPAPNGRRAGFQPPPEKGRSSFGPGSHCRKLVRCTHGCPLLRDPLVQKTPSHRSLS